MALIWFDESAGGFEISPRHYGEAVCLAIVGAPK
jgi:hypothetical protein